MGAVLRGGWSTLALPLALVGMIASGAAVTGVFYAASAEVAPEPPAELSAQASVVAEYGLRNVLSDSSRGLPITAVLPRDPVTVYETDTGSAAASYVVEWSPLSDTLAVLSSEGRVVVEGSVAVRTVKTVVPLTSAGTE